MKMTWLYLEIEKEWEREKPTKNDAKFEMLSRCWGTLSSGSEKCFQGEGREKTKNIKKMLDRIDDDKKKKTKKKNIIIKKKEKSPEKSEFKSNGSNEHWSTA